MSEDSVEGVVRQVPYVTESFDVTNSDVQDPRKTPTEFKKEER